jgi:hypothetical protein
MREIGVDVIDPAKTSALTHRRDGNQRFSVARARPARTICTQSLNGSLRWAVFALNPFTKSIHKRRDGKARGACVHDGMEATSDAASRKASAAHLPNSTLSGDQASPCHDRTERDFG